MIASKDLKVIGFQIAIVFEFAKRMVAMPSNVLRTIFGEVSTEVG